MAAVTSNTSALLRVVASSVAIARKSGTVIRNILKGGDLGVVNKVKTVGFIYLARPLFCQQGIEACA